MAQVIRNEAGSQWDVGFVNAVLRVLEQESKMLQALLVEM
jgi:hypothetical protein